MQIMTARRLNRAPNPHPKARLAMLVGPALLMLAACNGETASEVDPSEQGGEVSGDVLGGTISDAMIPLEQLQSQSPLAADLGEATNEEGAEIDDAEEAENEEGVLSDAESSAGPQVAPPLVPDTPEAEAPASDAPASDETSDSLPVAPPAPPPTSAPAGDEFASLR